MDTNLFSQMYLDFKQALELTEKLIFTVESHRRALTVILHKTSTQETCLRSYITILQYFGQKGA